MQRAFRFIVAIPFLLVGAGCLAGGLWVESAVLATVCFLLLYPWAPLRPAAAARTAWRMGAGKFTVLVFGALIAGTGPVLAFGLGWLSTRLPGCSFGGSGGPAYGCRLAGMDIDPVIGLVMPAFLASFFTVSAGLLLLLIGALWSNPKPVQVAAWVEASIAPPQPALQPPQPAPRSPASRIEIEDAVQEALLNYRAGCEVRTRCPGCHATLQVLSRATQPAPSLVQVDVACACGACDGSHALRRPQAV